jgi:Ca2+-binding EF-hand superfamily protein
MGATLGKSTQLKTMEQRFDTEELFTLRQTFTELACEHGGKCMSREAFQLLFRMPGVLSDRLFNAFDATHSGMIDYESFVTSLALFVRGDLHERLDFLFRIYDIDQNGRITREGLTTVLNSVLFAGYLIVSSQTNPELISDSISDVISNRVPCLFPDIHTL